MRHLWVTWVIDNINLYLGTGMDHQDYDDPLDNYQGLMFGFSFFPAVMTTKEYTEAPEHLSFSI